jgi:hypothetical protein
MTTRLVGSNGVGAGANGPPSRGIAGPTLGQAALRGRAAAVEIFAVERGLGRES